MHKCSLLFAFLLFSCVGFSQFPSEKTRQHNAFVFAQNASFISSFTAGAFHGFNQRITHHYYQSIQPRFPKNERFFNPKMSDQNPLILGYRLDAMHISATATQFAAFSAGGFAFDAIRRKPKKCLVIFVGNFISYSAGNMLVYDVILYKKK